MTRKRVYIAGTGGTIGMRRTGGGGYLPEPGFLEEQMKLLPELGHASMPEYVLHEYTPLLDSSNMAPEDWSRIAEDLQKNYQSYDGFIVLHGTDTMAYTASALPFMLHGLRKPVIVTGAQLPLSEPRSDARDNLVTSLLIASRFAIPEVCLYFGGRLLRGCRSVKISADGFQAFASPNYPPLGDVGINLEIHWERLRPAEGRPEFRVQRLERAIVGSLRLFPGISARFVEHVLQPPLKGLVLEAYGVGNAPDRDPDLLRVISEANERGVVIVACTQCLDGVVNLSDYATGAALARAGVISGFDMTAEAALAKLCYLWSTTTSADEVKRLMQTNLRGELTPPGDESRPRPDHA